MALYNLQVTLGAGATQLSATRAAASWINIQSRSGNNVAGIYIGNSAVLANGTQGGAKIAPGASFMLPQQDVPSPYDLTSVYVVGTGGDIVDVLYARR